MEDTTFSGSKVNRRKAYQLCTNYKLNKVFARYLHRDSLSFYCFITVTVDIYNKETSSLQSSIPASSYPQAVSPSRFSFISASYDVLE